MALKQLKLALVLDTFGFTTKVDEATGSAKKLESSLNKTSREVSNDIDKIGGAFSKAGAGLSSLAGFFGVGLGVAGAVAFGKQLAGVADDLVDLSAATGASVQSIGKFQFALDAGGGSAANVSILLTNLTNKIGEAKSGNQAAIDSFGKLGVSMADLNSLSTDKVMEKVANRLATTSDKSVAAATSMDLLGKAAKGISWGDFAAGLEKTVGLTDQQAAGIERLSAVKGNLDGFWIIFQQTAAAALGNAILGVENLFSKIANINKVNEKVSTSYLESLQKMSKAELEAERIAVAAAKSKEDAAMEYAESHAAGAALIASGYSVEIRMKEEAFAQLAKIDAENKAKEKAAAEKALDDKKIANEKAKADYVKKEAERIKEIQALDAKAQEESAKLREKDLSERLKMNYEIGKQVLENEKVLEAEKLKQVEEAAKQREALQEKAYSLSYSMLYRNKENELSELRRFTNIEIEDEYLKNQILDELRNQAAQNESDLATRRFDNQVANSQRVLGAFSAAAAAWSGQSRSAFEGFKALSIVEATISGLRAGVESYAWGSRIGGPILGGVMAALATVATAGQIAKIGQQKYTGRQFGGQVFKGSTYLVGEAGAEIFTPSQNGNILTNEKTKSVLNGGNSQSISITIQAPGVMDVSGFLEMIKSSKVAEAISRAVAGATARNEGVSLG